MIILILFYIIFHRYVLSSSPISYGKARSMLCNHYSPTYRNGMYAHRNRERERERDIIYVIRNTIVCFFIFILVYV